MFEQDNEKLMKILDNVSKYTADYLCVKISPCFDVLDDSLFNLAEKAETNKQQSHYFEFMRLIRLSREKIIKTFLQNVDNGFESLLSQKPDFITLQEESNPHHDTVKLELVDDKDLDESLAKSNLIKKSDTAYHKQMYLLSKRFSVFSQIEEIESLQNPISPHNIVSCFADGIGIIDSELKIRLIIYKLFERHVMGQLNDLYNQVNNIFINNNILPEIKFEIHKTPVKINTNKEPIQQEVNANHVSEKAQQPTQQIDIVSNQQNLDQNYQIISQLLKLSHQLAVNSSQNQVNVGAVNVVSVDLNIMIAALSLVQNSLFMNIQINDRINKSPLELKDDLIQQIHVLENDSHKVNQKDEDTIDLVGMLFQFIVDDRNLPNEIQLILVKLQIPYLKIALQDRNLFADKTHEARVLLNSLALASVGWTEKTDFNNQFISKIEEIVLHILECDHYNGQIFEVLQLNFDTFLTKLKKKSDVAQRRAKETTKGEDKINKAKQESAEILVEKMSGKQMPAFIRDILLGEWSNVLVLLHLRYSQDSAEYQGKVEFIDKVIELSDESSQSPDHAGDIIDLVQIYNSGLKLVAFLPNEIREKRKELITFLQGIHGIDEKAMNRNKLQLLTASNIFDIADMRNKKLELANYIEKVFEPNVEGIKSIDEKYIKMVSNLKVGDWLEFSQTPKPRIRAKLSWISPATGRYLFVNSRGIKVFDKPPLALAQGFKKWSIKALHKVALFDRALSSIALSLKKQQL
jgi:hypothetical protein